ncbi:hypothetical protein [Vibrio variabilis]|uniref:hypothetical protein n=1 Tax=Vibrio variabilis TaxID=990271 RepID=UPI000DD75F08|nr:hypothetical protein [Vibrio variabilis]
MVEKLCMANLLFPVMFIGERKGCLTVLVDRDYFDFSGQMQQFRATVSDMAQSLSDPWYAEVGYFDTNGNDVTNESSMIIQDVEPKAKTYLLNIHNLWSLGIKDYRV